MVSKKKTPAKKAIARKPMKKSSNPFTEKKTGERYASKTAMKKHEKKESPSEMRKEYGKSFKKGMR